MLRMRALRVIASLSAVPAHSGGSEPFALAAASTRLFLTGEKHNQRSSWEKPTLASAFDDLRVQGLGFRHNQRSSGEKPTLASAFDDLRV